MAKKIRRMFTDETKIKILHDIENNYEIKNDGLRQYGLSSSVYSSWKRKLKSRIKNLPMLINQNHNPNSIPVNKQTLQELDKELQSILENIVNQRIAIRHLLLSEREREQAGK